MNYNNVCDISSCQEKPKYICYCQATKSIFCKKHKKRHKNHNYQYLHQEPTKPITTTILHYLQEEKSKIQNIKSKFFSEVSTNIKNLEVVNKNGLKSIDSGIKIIDQFIRKILTTKEIRVDDEDPLLKILLLNNTDEAQIQLENFMSGNINYGEIANTCYQNDIDQERTLEVNRGNNAGRINELEKDVIFLKSEVKRLNQIVENMRQASSRNEANVIGASQNANYQPKIENQASRNQAPIISNTDFSQNAYYEQMREYQTYQSRNEAPFISNIDISQSTYLEPIIENPTYQASQSQAPFTNLSQSAYIQPIREYHTYQPENPPQISSSQLYRTIGNENLNNTMICLLPDQKQGFSDINDNSYLSSVLQVLASTSLFVEISKNIQDPSLSILNALFSAMKRPNAQNFIDNLLSDFSINFTQGFSSPNFIKDPKYATNWCINKLYEYFPPNSKSFSSLITKKIKCEAGHELITPELINIIEILNIKNRPINEEIDENMKISEGFCGDCKQNKKMTGVVDIEVPSIFILNLPFDNQYVLPEEFDYKGSRYCIYGAIKCLYRLEDLNKYVAYTKDGDIWREYIDSNSKTWQPDFSSCYLGFYISS